MILGNIREKNKKRIRKKIEMNERKMKAKVNIRMKCDNDSKQYKKGKLYAPSFALNHFLYTSNCYFY